MTQSYRFDGRVAVVTGAGGNPSLGRAHALLLASRGAQVVVNDIGHDPETPGYTGRASAAQVVDEIRAAGGQAVASDASVADEDGARAIIAAAIDAFGRIDVLVNNAGISIAAPIDVMSPRDFQRHIQVNLMGAYYCCRAAWPHMRAQGYGRIVNTTSGAMTGFADQAAYGASKGGLWSLTRALAVEGLDHGIRVNALSPGGYTRMVAAMLEETSPLLQHTREAMPPELSSPALAFLVHEACPVSGECIDAAGGHIQRTFIARTVGAKPGAGKQEDVGPGGVRRAAATIEDVAAQWGQVMDTAAAETIGLADFDTSQWQVKPYQAERTHV